MRSHLDLNESPKTRRHFLKWSVEIVAVAAVVACAPAAQPSPPAAQPTAAPASTPAQAAGTAAPTQPAAAIVAPTATVAPAQQAVSTANSPVTLTTNNHYMGAKGFEQFVTEYRKVLDAAGLQHLSYEYQEADSTALETRMAAGDAPDLIYVYPELLQPWAARQQVVSLQSYVDGDSTWKTNVGTFIKSMNDGYTYKGKLYGLTMAAEAECTAWNPLQFKKNNVKTPSEIGQDGWTLDKLAETVAATTDHSGSPPMKGYFASMEFNQGLGDMVSGYGGTYFSDDGRKALFNSKEFVQAVGFIAKLVKDGAALNGIQSAKDGQWVAAALSNKLSAVIIAGDWAWGWAHKTQLDKKEFDPGMFYIPAGPAGRKPIAHSAGLAIYAQTKNRDAALEFIKFGFTKEYQGVNARLYEVSPQFPGRLDAATPIFDKKLLPDFFPKLFDNSIPSPYTPVVNPYPIYGYMNDAFDAIFKGKETRPIQQVMDELAGRAQKDLDAAAVSLG